MKHFEAQLEVEINTSLGEGPLWHKKEGRLYFIDIVNFKVHSYDPVSKDTHKWKLPSYVGAIAHGEENELYAAVQSKLMLLNTKTGSIKTILTLDLEKNIRFNECKCDSQGRFWMGTMHLEAQKEAGAFYKVDLDGSVTKVLTNLSVPNGFCWSEDNRFLYHIDSFDYSVKRFEYDEKSGSLSSPETVVQVGDGGVVPDGMCMDRAENLWIALWGGNKVVCYSPVNGELLAEVTVPSPHVTSCAFGGENFDILYITTARLGLTKEQLKEYPLSGSLFSCEVGVGGFESNQCKVRA